MLVELISGHTAVVDDGGQAVLRIRPGGTAWSAAGDEAVVLDLERSAYVGLNDTASFLWQRLVAGSTEQALVDDLLAGYDVDAATARAEVRAFVDDLHRRGYLKGQ